MLGVACDLEHSHPPFVRGQIELDQWLRGPINRITCRIITIKRFPDYPPQAYCIRISRASAQESVFFKVFQEILKICHV